jgi:hypothetical protein
MGKRKGKDAGEESSGEEDFDMVNVDFEFFDPQPAIDFHGIKNLCRQLFDLDAPLFDLSALTDLVLAQPTLGSTVKVDGNESDPYAFLTVVNLKEHKVCDSTSNETCKLTVPGKTLYIYDYRLSQVKIVNNTAARQATRTLERRRSRSYPD